MIKKISGILAIVLVSLMFFTYGLTLVNTYTYTVTPTELITFLIEDETDSNNYTAYYRCAEFCVDVIENAEEKDYKVGFVILYPIYEQYSHAIIVFETTTGLVFVEPQSDIAFNQTVMNQMLEEQVYNFEPDKLRFEFDSYTIFWNYNFTMTCYYYILILMSLFMFIVLFEFFRYLFAVVHLLTSKEYKDYRVKMRKWRQSMKEGSYHKGFNEKKS